MTLHRLGFLLGALALLLLGCTETTAPALQRPDSLALNFQKTNAARGDGGGGGGGGGSASVCEFPNHLSGERCLNATGQVVAATGGYLARCSASLGWACYGAAIPTAGVWQNWANTPDANGITGSTPDPNWPDMYCHTNCYNPVRGGPGDSWQGPGGL